MKSCLSILLLPCYALVIFASLLPFVGFELNREYIVAELCVDRANEASCCKGACFLEKKLKEANGAENEQSTLRTELFLEYLPKDPIRDFRALRVEKGDRQLARIHQACRVLNRPPGKTYRPPAV